VTLPRILIAEDHSETRERIANLLASAFDIAAIVSDGQRAVDATASLEPSVVVLDISMPVLGGFAAAARIRTLAQAPAIVFLTAHDDPALAQAALSLGASAFVLKRKMMTDLIPAIHRALNVSSRRIGETYAGPGSIHGPLVSRDHGVIFYDETRSLSKTVAQFIAEGLAAEQAALVVATQAHNAAIMEQLTAMALDPETRIAQGHLVVFDAPTLLGRLLIDDMPSLRLMNEEVAPVVERVTGGYTRVVRAYGEMVDLLWSSHREAAALALETEWNRLAAPRPFPLLCGYARAGVAHAGSYRTICEQHTHVVSGGNTIALA
jgi:DNA-binding NarL/FixJ family response regulator